MSNSIAKNFNFFSLLKFTFPSMIMMIFMSLYTIVDGVFISRFVGSVALSASNIVFPVICFIIAVGVMLSNGGSAIIARQLGENRPKDARKNFTFIIITGLVTGVILMLLGNIFIEPLVRLLGATDEMLKDSIDYLRILLYFSSACILQHLFQAFMVTAGKPVLGLIMTFSGGIANIILDYIFMGPLKLGISGAALATGIGQLIPTVFGLFYFLFVRHSLYFAKPKFNWSVLKESCLNGSSEMVTNLSSAVVTYLYNITMLRLVGEPGVAAITIVLYAKFLFNAIYMGFSMGVAPVISFNHGSKNHRMLQKLFKICVGFIGTSSLLVTGLALVACPYIVEIFTPIGTDTYQIAKSGFFLFSINYIFAGLNIFSSSMFTAFSDGKTSAIISFVRTFVLLVMNILILPLLIGIHGVWLSVPLAELMTVFLSIYYFYKKRKIYCYLP